MDEMEEFERRWYGMLNHIQQAGEKGIQYETLRTLTTGSDAQFEEALNELLDRGLIWEPILGIFKVI